MANELSNLNRIAQILKEGRKEFERDLNAMDLRDKREAKIKRAKKAFVKFTDGVKKPSIKALQMPKNDVMYELGKLVAVVYEADTSDGKGSLYKHQFTKSSQPHLAVSFDGTQLYIVGGQYIVDDRGIVDTRHKSIKRKVRK